MLNGQWNGHSEQNDKCDNKCDCITHSEWKNWWAGWKHNKFAGIEMAGVISTKNITHTQIWYISTQNFLSKYYTILTVDTNIHEINVFDKPHQIDNGWELWHRCSGRDVKQFFYGPHKGDWVWTNKCNVMWWECKWWKVQFLLNGVYSRSLAHTLELITGLAHSFHVLSCLEDYRACFSFW